jgi:methionine sulfoxide reductase heme-binding subunit
MASLTSDRPQAGAARRFGISLAAVKWAIFLLALVPLLRLIGLGLSGKLGSNPVEFVTRSTGTWTLVLLCVTLAVTPVRRITGWNKLLRYRRMLGLFTFFYGVLHFTTYIWFDQWFDLIDIGKDIVKRPFVTVGFAAFVLMIPLALTSNSYSIRKLGRRWARLHRLIYLVAIAAILHYLWHKGGKNNYTEPLIYAAIVVGLLAIRLAYWWQGGRRAAAART